MAIVQISRIQQRRGLQQDLPQLASAELGWSLDTRRLFIGNGTFEEGASALGVTEILTDQTPLLNLLKTYTFKGLSAGYQVTTGPTGTQPVLRTLQDKIDDIVSVKDFGATGDGITDDTAAIQRALTRAFSTNQVTFNNNYHRTINFPAGTYLVTSTINIPPYSRIQGEGKKTTIIKGRFSGAIAQFADSFGQTGVNYGQTNVSGTTPDTSEYHINDISFLQTTLSAEYPCVVIDGCFTATFNRVMFEGLLTHDVAGSNYYDRDRGTGVAAVAINNMSNYQAVRNIVFSQCDFYRQNYGIELNQDSHGISISDCFFDSLWCGIIAGYNSPDPTNYIPYDISVRDNYFRYSAIEAVKCNTYVTNVMSIGNSFTGAGLMDYESTSPTVNPSGIAQTPVITYNANNNYSIADSFSRTSADYAAYPSVQINSYDCFIIGQDLGFVNGRQTNGRAHTLSLGSSATFVSTGITYIPSAYTNVTMEYALNANGNNRTGTFRIARVGSTYNWSDDFSETGETQVYFQANTSTGNIEYTSVSSATLTYSLKYFTA